MGSLLDSLLKSTKGTEDELSKHYAPDENGLSPESYRTKRDAMAEMGLQMGIPEDESKFEELNSNNSIKFNPMRADKFSRLQKIIKNK